MSKAKDNQLGQFLRSRRAKLDPAEFGFPVVNRRTPGLRREEVAQRAHLSATWYTWLEQGRGGDPSATVLERIARALVLSPVEREHLFLLGQGHPPELSRHIPVGEVPKLQRMLDTMELIPAFVKTPTWDVVAWNRASALVLTDHSLLPPERRNVLKLLFLDRDVRASIANWESSARLAVATFRRETTRAGLSDAARKLVEDLSKSSPEFAHMWNDGVVSDFGTGEKIINHSSVGPLVLEYATFAIDTKPDLALVVYTPATDADREKVRLLVEGARKSQIKLRAVNRNG